MLRDAAFIARKDVKYTLRARESALWVFVMPIVFFYFIGTVTGGMGSRPRGTDKMAVMADTSSGFLADQLIHQLEERNYQVVLPDSISQFAAYARRLTVPASFTDSVLAGKAVALEFTNDTRGLNKDYHTIRTQRAVYTLLADFVVVKETEGKATPAGFDRLRETPRALQLTVTPAGERQRIPSGFEQAIPGIMVMFTLLVMGTSGAILLVLERKQGLLKRLAYTPIDRLGVVLGKWGGKWLVGIVQITFAMLAGTLLFKMDWGPDLPMVVVVMLIYGALMASIGVILGSLARTEGQAVAIGVIAANVLGALGGCWWPIEITPAWMQTLQLFLPTGWAMDALHRLISFAAGPASVVPHVLGMLLATVVLVFIGTRVFRFE